MNCSSLLDVVVLCLKPFWNGERGALCQAGAHEKLDVDILARISFMMCTGNFRLSPDPGENIPRYFLIHRK